MENDQRGKSRCAEEVRYPAKEPPTQAIVAGENAGAFPALAPARAEPPLGGLGLFKMAKWGSRGRREA